MADSERRVAAAAGRTALAVEVDVAFDPITVTSFRATRYVPAPACLTTERDLGVAGIKQRRRGKVFAILGVILSAALLLVSLPLWATSPR